MSIVTDSIAEYPENVFKIHQLFRTNEELDKIYSENKGQYKKLKDLLIDDIKAFIRPLREKRKEISGDGDLVKKVLEVGKRKASAVADAKMAEVRHAVGVD